MNTFIVTALVILLIIIVIIIVVLKKTSSLYKDNDKTEEQREIERKARLFDEMMKDSGSENSK